MPSSMLRTEMFSHELKSVDAIKNVIDGTVPHFGFGRCA